MALNSALGSLVFVLWVSEIWAGFTQEGCANKTYGWDDKVFSVPGNVAMMEHSLLSPLLDVLNYTAVPYNITWYNSRTGQEMSNQTGRILMLGETLWFLNTALEDAGEYMTILRTHCCCYMQSTMLVVDMPNVGECGRPQKASEKLRGGVANRLNCPLRDYINKLESYGITSSIQWYKGCQPILDGSDKYTYWHKTLLNINRVEPEDSGTYTCTLTFTLGGVTGSVSESIDAPIREDYSWIPRILEPAGETIKAEKGSNFTRKCLVFVRGREKPSATLFWLVRNHSILNHTHPARIYSPEKRSNRAAAQEEGWLLERDLIISELRGEDFHINYTCRLDSSWGISREYFTLLPADPNTNLTVGCVLGGLGLLFIVSATIYYINRIDIVLWFRRMFQCFYTDKDQKLYDAYVVYPHPDAFGLCEEVEKFALHTLPDVLEKACGYKLFIAGRDCLPGQAIFDSVNENIQASRRVLLLYSASTYCSRNVSESTDGDQTSDTRQQLEHATTMHRVLLEGSLKVILVELEEITPDQLALFPESVRHLRKKQGAVCWWKYVQKRQTWRTCVREREDKEKHEQDSQLSLSLCPSSRFWKEIRFHMPVRGKRVGYPEKTALLNL